MNRKELVKFLIENFTDVDGDLDLRNLDFSDFEGNVLISGMEVKGDLKQSRQIVRGILYQERQQVQGDLMQDCQEVNGDLWQSDQEVNGDLISDLVNVQEFIKEYTFDELNEFIKELQIANNVRGSEND